jgi:serine/threonine-protein kinase
MPPEGGFETATELPSPSIRDASAAGVDAVPGYEILGVLGRGGMGVVYKARQVGLNRLCALKMILAGGHAGEADLARFHTEAEAIARLQHPNIVAVYEVGLHQGKPYLSLEFCAGGSLDRKLAGTPIEPAEAAKLVRTLAEAMQAAHAANVIHRDLKPANVLLASGGCQPPERGPQTPGGLHPPLAFVLKITDFGLAKKLDEASRTATNAIMGTPSYMAPEQAEGKKQVGPAADVYALGAILYECLTGRPPFKAATALDTIMQVVADEPVPPRQLNAKVPRDLETICLKCLQKEPGKRYSSAAALADDLGRHLAGEPIRARRVGRLERAGKWVRRNPVVAALLAGVLLAVAIGGWALWERSAQQASQRMELAQRVAETERAVSLALGKAEQLRDQARQLPSATSQQAEAAAGVWRQAEAALEQAEAALSTGAAADPLLQRVSDVREEIERGRRHALRKGKLLRGLDEARMARSTWIDSELDNAGASTRYAQAFAAYGLDVTRGRSEELARQIRSEEPDVREALIVALLDWTFVAKLAKSEGLMKVLSKIAQGADDDGWRNKFRAAWAARDRAALRSLAAEARRLSLPSSSVEFLGVVLEALDEHDDALGLLRWARNRYPSDFWIAFQLGSVLRRGSNQTPVEIEEAIGSYRVARALSPGSTIVLNDLGFALEQEKRFEEAIACYRRAIDIDHRFMPARYNLANALKKTGKLVEAVACYRAAIDLAPRDVKAHAGLGLALSTQGKVEEAIAAHRRTIAIDPNYVAGHCNLGAALRSRKKLDEAVACFRKAIEVDSQSALAHASLGQVFADRGKVDDAIAYYRKALAIEPKFALAHVGLGGALRATGKVDEAIACYQKALAIDPNAADAHVQLGAILCDVKRDHEGAIVRFRKAIEIDPRHAWAHFNLGVALRDRGKVDEAIPLWRKAIEIDPHHAPAYYNLGNAMLARGNDNEAIACWRKAIQSNPQHAHAHYHLANALVARGKDDEAIASYRKAIASEPRLAPAYTNLGFVLPRKGKVDEAISCWRLAIASDPRLANAYTMLGQALVQQGELGAAQSTLRRCLAMMPANHPMRVSTSRLLRQYRKLVEADAKLKAYLAGKGTPADAGSAVDLAEVAQMPFHRLTVTATRFYRDAFAQDPKLVSAHSFRAACSATLSAAGRGKDAGKLDGNERASLRKEALAWLRAELDTLQKQLENSTPRDRQALQTTLQDWQRHSDLASVRDKADLAKLSSEERQEWSALWADVADLLTRGSAGK